MAGVVADTRAGTRMAGVVVVVVVAEAGAGAGTTTTTMMGTTSLVTSTTGAGAQGGGHANTERVEARAYLEVWEPFCYYI